MLVIIYLLFLPVKLLTEILNMIPVTGSLYDYIVVKII